MENNIGLGAVDENTSGQGKDAFVPAEVAEKFNWGAFCWTLIWGLTYKKPIALLVLVLGLIPVVGVMANLGLSVWFGIKGNTWAWQARRYESVEDFHKRQKRWVFAFLIFFVIAIALYAKLASVLLKTTKQETIYKMNLSEVANILEHNHYTNSKFMHSFPKGTPVELVSYFTRQQNGNYKSINISTIAIEGMQGSEIIVTFKGGNCKNNECMVFADINGNKKPNKYWKKGDKELSDRYVFYIKYNGKNSYEIIKPEAIEY